MSETIDQLVFSVVFGKHFEKTIHAHLHAFLIEFKILYELQFGFRNNHSTNLTIIDIVERIRDALDKGENVIEIYLDLQKAFDTVNHEILLNKLAHYGIQGKQQSWFSGYLSDRCQFVTINNIQSECKSINIGVPQGSVLSPVLFVLYINDIRNIARISDTAIKLFDDDTNVFLHGKNVIDLKKKTDGQQTEFEHEQN